jgi:TonB family protein
MLTAMSGLWMMMREGGFGATLAVLLGLMGLLVGLGAAATLIASRRAAFGVGIAALALAFLTGVSGIAGMALGWRSVQQAVAGGVVDQVDRDRILREGFEEAQGAAMIGFGASLLPLLLGGLATAASAGAKGPAPAPVPPGWNVAAGPPPAPPSGSGGRIAIAAVGIGLGLLTTIGAFVASHTAPPATKYAFEEDDGEAWALASAREHVDTDHDRGCDELADALGRLQAPGTRASWPRVFVRDPDKLVPDWRVAATACATGIWAHVKAASRWSRRPDTLGTAPKVWTRDELLDSPLLVDETLHAEITALPPPTTATAAAMPTATGIGSGVGVVPGRTAAAAPTHSASAPEGKLMTGSTTVSGRLPPEVIQRVVRQHMAVLRACYQQGLARNPSLSGTVKVKFVIDASGAVTSVSDAGSDLPDEDVKTCVRNQIKTFSFPQPEGGIVTVTYPFVFKSAP